jgi:hypothetical protein
MLAAMCQRLSAADVRFLAGDVGQGQALYAAAAVEALDQQKQSVRLSIVKHH